MMTAFGVRACSNVTMVVPNAMSCGPLSTFCGRRWPKSVSRRGDPSRPSAPYRAEVRLSHRPRRNIDPLDRLVPMLVWNVFWRVFVKRLLSRTASQLVIPAERLSPWAPKDPEPAAGGGWRRFSNWQFRYCGPLDHRRGGASHL